jgi:hypothetical protein
MYSRGILRSIMRGILKRVLKNLTAVFHSVSLKHPDAASEHWKHA